MQPTEPVRGSQPDFPKPSQEIWKTIKKFSLVALISIVCILLFKTCFGFIFMLDQKQIVNSIERSAREEQLAKKLVRDEKKWFAACAQDNKKLYECKALWAAAGGRVPMDERQ
jgi:hypothetical protein